MKNIFSFFKIKSNFNSDEELVEALFKGDQSAFEVIYKKYALKLYNIAFNQLGSQEDAEEIVQELFVSLWKRREILNIKNLNAYLIISIKNKVYDSINSRINFRKYQEYVILKEVYDNDDTNNIVNFNDLMKAVDEVLSRLPEKTAEVFRRSRFEKQPIKEIAQAMNLSDKAVEYHITKSIKLFKEHLQGFTTLN
jgi:RNA polymerase sigma-70 factor (family 1)